MPVNIHGKDYKTVAERVADFRDKDSASSDYSIITEIIRSDDIVQMKASILSEEGRVIATGFAEEVRGSTNINKTSALENCETSAIGRALSSFGLGGTEYASANEVMNAIAQQVEMATKEKAVSFYKDHAEAVKRNFESLVFIREQIALDNYEEAREAYAEIDGKDQEALWVAPSKGGFFTTEERAVINGTKTQESAA
jgi:deoxycytidylate deaminase